MNRSLRYVTLIAALIILSSATKWPFSMIATEKIINPAPLPSRQKVLLIPLDSRPPCTEFVVNLGKLSGIEIILPPSSYIGNYEQLGNQAALRQWLAETIDQANAAIISSDMLIHGGLLASRQSRGTPDDVSATLALLSQIHSQKPQIPLYVFSIIPRLLLADSPSGSYWQKPLSDYSVLKHQVSLFDNPRDLHKLLEWEQTIPPKFINNYRALYEQSTNINKALINLANRGVITTLTLGQDDGQPFGLPNLSKEKLLHYASQSNTLSHRVTITRGTDEVALTLLGHYANTINNYKPRIFIAWSHPKSPTMVMPFMPHSTARTAEEKIALIGGQAVSTVNEADFILYIHTGNRNIKPSQLTAAAKTVDQFIKQGYQVAVVDLTENYFAHETLLPYLVENNVDLTKLVAYAGWNTTSNSIGTAITQGALFTGSLRSSSDSEKLSVYGAHLNFLASRFLDDWHYLKDIQPFINHDLKAAKVNPYHLGNHYSITNQRIMRLLTSRGAYFFRHSLAGRTIVVSNTEYQLADMSLTCKLPWDRTFEISLQTHLRFREIKSTDNQP